MCQLDCSLIWVDWNVFVEEGKLICYDRREQRFYVGVEVTAVVGVDGRSCHPLGRSLCVLRRGHRVVLGNLDERRTGDAAGVPSWRVRADAQHNASSHRSRVSVGGQSRVCDEPFHAVQRRPAR